MLDDKERQAIRERVNKATPGPWEWDKACNIWGPYHAKVINWDSDTVIVADIRFIAHAREDVPKLLDEVERLEKENTYHSLQLDRARKEIERLREAKRG